MDGGGDGFEHVFEGGGSRAHALVVKVKGGGGRCMYEGARADLTVFVIAEQIVSHQERPSEQRAHRFDQTARRGV